MKFTRLLLPPMSRGLILCIFGFLIVTLSYLLLPFGVASACNEWFCPSNKTPTLAFFLETSFPSTPFFTILILIPITMAIVIPVLGLFYSRYPRRILLRWLLGSGITGFTSLLVFTALTLIVYYPFIGALGTFLGYALFFWGYRSLIASQTTA